MESFESLVAQGLWFLKLRRVVVCEFTAFYYLAVRLHDVLTASFGLHHKVKGFWSVFLCRAFGKVNDNNNKKKKSLQNKSL